MTTLSVLIGAALAQVILVWALDATVGDALRNFLWTVVGVLSVWVAQVFHGR